MDEDDDEFADPVIEEVYYDESDESREVEGSNTAEDDAVIALLSVTASGSATTNTTTTSASASAPQKSQQSEAEHLLQLQQKQDHPLEQTRQPNSKRSTPPSRRRNAVVGSVPGEEGGAHYDSNGGLDDEYGEEGEEDDEYDDEYDEEDDINEYLDDEDEDGGDGEGDEQFAEEGEEPRNRRRLRRLRHNSAGEGEIADEGDLVEHVGSGSDEDADLDADLDGDRGDVEFDDDEHFGEDYDEELEALSLSPGSSAMMMIGDAGHGEDLYTPIDFATISVENLIREHNRNPDLLYMIEVGDPALVNWLCTKQTVTKLVFALCEQFSMLHMEDAITVGRTYEKDVLSSFSHYLITSAPNGALPTYILDNPELFDLFFTLTLPSEFRASAYWTRVMLFLLSKNTSTHSIIDYMNSPLPEDIEASLASLSIHPKHEDSEHPTSPSSTTAQDTTTKHTARGQFAISCLLRLSGNDNVARLIASLLFPEEPTVPWIQILASCHFTTLLGQRFEAMMAQSNLQFRVHGQSEAANITELIGLITTKAGNTELCEQLQQADFANRLVQVVGQKEPHPLASHCLNIMCHLFDISFNNDDYESQHYPPIVAALIAEGAEDKHTGTASTHGTQPNDGSSTSRSSFDGKGKMAPLSYWAWQLDHPTLQIIPPEQIHDPSRQPFGMYRFQLLRSVNNLLKTNYGLLHREMFRTGLVSSVMDAMFRHSLSSLIHLCVSETIGNVMYVERTEWLVEWLAKYEFVEKVATGFELAAPHLSNTTSSSPSSSSSSDLSPSSTKSNAEPQSSTPTSEKPTKSLVPKAEYAPQLVAICAKLERLSASNGPLQALLSSNPKWECVLHTFTETLAKQYCELSDVSTIRRNAGSSMIAF